MQPTQQYHGSPNWTQWWLLVTLSFHVLSPQHHIAPPPIKVLWIILGMHVTESVQALRINSSLLNYPRRGFVAPKRLLLKKHFHFLWKCTHTCLSKVPGSKQGTFLVCFEKLRVIHGNWAKIKGSTTAKGMHFKPRKYPHSIPPPNKWPTRLNMAFGSHKFPWGFCVPWPAMSNKCIHSGDSSTVSCITLYASWLLIN